VQIQRPYFGDGKKSKKSVGMGRYVKASNNTALTPREAHTAFIANTTPKHPVPLHKGNNNQGSGEQTKLEGEQRIEMSPLTIKGTAPLLLKSTI